MTVATLAYPPSCVQCGAPPAMTNDRPGPGALHTTYLVCSEGHGYSVNWVEGA